MLGILVHGDNHFIVEGPRLDREMARRLAWRWEVPRLGEPAAEEEAPLPWRIVTKAFREDLEWAIVLRCEEEEVSVAVQELLNGLAARGIEIERG